MLVDRYGLPLSTSSAAARDAYIAGVDCLLSAAHGDQAHLERAVANDPDFALAHAALARARFLMANISGARQSAARARELAPKVTPREQSHIDALCLAIEGNPVGAFAATRAHLAEHPRDAMVASPATGVFGLIGFSGRQGREPEQVEFLDALKPHLANDWWFQAVYAFALEEHGRLDEALELIERSMATNPKNAHGAHIKAHVLYEMGEDRTALDYLDAWLPTYEREGLMHCHISWHVALFALMLGNTERAWQVYQAQVHPGGAWGPALNVATDAPAFLWRAELAGYGRKPALWNEVHAYGQKSFPKPGIAFVDVHRALASVAAGDREGIAAYVAELEQRAASGRSPAGDVVPRLANGLSAYGDGDWAKAIAILEPALAETVRIGGSRAQRDLIENTLLAAYLKAGRETDARKLLAAHTDRRPSVPVAGLS
ncbi:tetratricopeptide repeat protein [Reyranella soli]|uniref:Tetratricopeptide repeat protein 38 n=1 Tax=Reyranella soli TaxID=1230389 RepID=A0A512NHJ4_9HYPH|nr:tetratricopeptide repeat protein [Reyranella soli]GEP58443.1 tetratricopeptide repeat protein 38 family protein [Reyranella soli]